MLIALGECIALSFSPSLSIIYLLAKKGRKKMGKEFHTLLSLIFRVQHTPEEKEEREEKCNEDNFEVK